MKKIIIVLMGFLVISSANAHANREKEVSQGALHGVPFQQLSAEIDANRALIEENSASITSFKSTLSELQNQIDSVEGTLSTLSNRVDSNSSQLDEAFSLLENFQGDMTTLRGELSDLAAQHYDDMATIQSTIVRIQSELNALGGSISALSRELNSEIVELRDQISQEAVGIDSLLADIVLINAQLTTLNSAYNTLSNTQNNLVNQMSNYDTRLENLASALSTLKDQSGEGQTDPCHSTITIGTTVEGGLIDYSCMYEADRYASNAAKFYTFVISSPQKVNIDLKGLSSGAGSLADPFLYLLNGADETGEVIMWNDDGGEFLDSHITAYLEPGFYTIVASAYWGYMGTYQLSVGVDPDSSPLTEMGNPYNLFSWCC